MLAVLQSRPRVPLTHHDEGEPPLHGGDPGPRLGEVLGGRGQLLQRPLREAVPGGLVLVLVLVQVMLVVVLLVVLEVWWHLAALSPSIR